MTHRTTAHAQLGRKIRRGLVAALGLIALAFPVSAQADRPADPGHSGDNQALGADWQGPPPWAPAWGNDASGVSGRKVG